MCHTEPQHTWNMLLLFPSMPLLPTTRPNHGAYCMGDAAAVACSRLRLHCYTLYTLQRVNNGKLLQAKSFPLRPEKLFNIKLVLVHFVLFAMSSFQYLIDDLVHNSGRASVEQKVAQLWRGCRVRLG